jgi:hypothetical protein
VLPPSRGPAPFPSSLAQLPTQQRHCQKVRNQTPAHRTRPRPLQELESRGIWDFDRLCEPWITDEVLRETFGAELAPEVAARYLQEQVGGRYRFRKMYARCGGKAWRECLRVGACKQGISWFVRMRLAMWGATALRLRCLR